MTLALSWDHYGPCALTTAMIMPDSGRWPWLHGAAVVAARRMAAGGACGPPRVVRERWSFPMALLPARPSACAQRGQGRWTGMCCDSARRCARAPALAILHCSRADLRWMVITGSMLICSISSWWPLVRCPVKRVRSCWTPFGRGSCQAHPVWPPDMRAAALAGIICAGMPADMVRLAWGHPTRTSGRDGPGQPETSYYAGRPSAVERLAGWGLNDAGGSRWTVSFIDGQVVAWTD